MVRLLLGDCIDLMATLPENSVDAVVCDPPYGLEFMGKEWDRLSTDPDIGKMRRTGFDRLDGKPDQREQNAGGTWFGSRESSAPNYYRSTNVKCRTCGKWKISGGHDGKGNTLGCKCETPDFPNVKAEAARSMQAWHEQWARAALRVLKPGGHLLAFGSTRTHHRMMCAIEDAGFEIRDTMLYWGYSTGFPKSLDISKALDKMAGAEHLREFSHKNPADRPYTYTHGETSTGWQSPIRPDKTLPATDLARQWSGWGTALKPAYEPIVMARKPLSEASVAANVSRWSVGGLNIDGCRIPHNEPEKRTTRTIASSLLARERQAEQGYRPAGDVYANEEAFRADYLASPSPAGRWPSNVILSEQAAAELDAAVGERKSSGIYSPANHNDTGTGFIGRANDPERHRMYGDTGGPSRFFYVAKASRRERNYGCEGLPEQESRRYGDRAQGPLPQQTPQGAIRMQNTHPTVKPIALMRHLVRLVTPPNGTVLDPFMGSGSTGIAAVLEGFDFIGMEKEPEYMTIANARILAAEAEVAIPLLVDV